MYKQIILIPLLLTASIASPIKRGTYGTYVGIQKCVNVCKPGENIWVTSSDDVGCRFGVYDAGSGQPYVCNISAVPCEFRYVCPSK